MKKYYQERKNCTSNDSNPYKCIYSGIDIENTKLNKNRGNVYTEYTLYAFCDTFVNTT